MSRPVRVATITLESDFQHSTREQAFGYVEQAGKAGADLVCLPEYGAGDCVPGRFVPTPVPGPITDDFAALAARYHCYVVAPVVEEAPGGKPYNTAVLLGRRGELVGRYRKTHLCLPGHQEGERYRAGDELPVFALDFGTIAITTCMDLHYPELYGALALRGAELICWPSGAMDYTGDLIESLVNARAVDNQVYFVSSHYVQTPYLVGRPCGRSRIVDPMGRTRADTGHFAGLASATIDLDQTYPMWYQGAMLAAYPTMRETLFKTRRPELYGDLTTPVQPRHWQRGPPPATAKPSRDPVR